MDARVRARGPVAGTLRVPGDKSIAHRWILLASTAHGRSELRGLPAALDVRSTARVCASLLRADARAALEGWASNPGAAADGDGSTANNREPPAAGVVLEARGRAGLESPDGPLDCGNSGTTMRLLAGILASSPFAVELRGDASLSSRPMERVAEPLRAMGASVTTLDGHAPVRVTGRDLTGISWATSVPSAQVKGAVLLAGVDADGRTSVREPAATRDHTERALEALGTPIGHDDGAITVERFQHPGFAGTVPGDVSSAAFLIAAALVTRGHVEIRDVGLNPSRTFLFEILRRMGASIRVEVQERVLGEPVGTLEVEGPDGLVATTVTAAELPLVIDEVPVIAVLAASAAGTSRFEGSSELRLKESDRLHAIVDLLRAVRGEAAVEGDDLVVDGGGVLDGGVVDPRGDHRIAMAAAVAGLSAPEPVEIVDAGCADVSFPGFFSTLARLGAEVG